MLIKSLTGSTVLNPLSRVIDLACVVAAYAGATLVASELGRFGMFVWPGSAASDIWGWPAQYIVLFLTGLLVRGATAGYFSHHRSDDSLNTPMNLAIRSALLWAAVIGVSMFLLKLSDVSRVFVLCFVGVESVFCVVSGHLEQYLRAKQQDKKKIALVIARGTQGDWLTAYLRRHFCPQPYTLIECLPPESLRTLGTQLLKRPIGGPNSEAPAVEAFLAGADMSEDAPEVVPLLLKSGTRIHLVPAVFDASIFRLNLSDLGGVPLVTIRGGELDPLEAAAKRVFDFAGGLIALALASPLMAAIAMLVKMSSPGPILFRQERLGKNGKRIFIYKFRTMHRDAEKMLRADRELYSQYLENNYKLPKDGDPRVTAVGRMLRQLSLDELPQLINVIKGEMSLVGPRPIVPDEIQRYGDCAAMVLSVQPGLTGQWQVSGRSDIADYAQRIQLDLEYLRDQSLATDLRILAKTVPAVLLRQGAH